MDIRELQEAQARYDAQYWQHNASELEKIRHITLHLAKLLGKLATYCERQEHGEPFPTTQIQGEVIPDLLVYSSQLANLLGEDLGERYKSRLEDNIRRLLGERK